MDRSTASARRCGLDPPTPEDIPEEPGGDEDDEREDEPLDRARILGDEADGHQGGHDDDGERRARPVGGTLAAREAGETDGADLDQRSPATRARSGPLPRPRTRGRLAAPPAERRGAGRRARSSPAQSRCDVVVRGEEAEHDQDDDRREGVGGLTASARRAATASSIERSMRFGHPPHCTHRPAPGPSVPRASRLIRSAEIAACLVPIGRGGSARSADGSPTVHAPAFGDHQSRRRRSAVAAAHPAQERDQALRRRGRNPLSTTSTSRSRPAGSPRSWGRPAAASPRSST